MISDTVDPYVAEAATRRADEAASANYSYHKQANAALATQTKFVNMDTGEITYAELPSETNTAAEASATALVEPKGQAPVQSTDADTAFRRARLGVVAVIVLILFWLWLRQRRTA